MGCISQGSETVLMLMERSDRGEGGAELEEGLLSAKGPPHHPLQSVTAKQPHLPWWFTLLESLFLFFLVKLLQL
ncbi:uncharacterized protein LOC108090676 [Drosophila ficusphila]|uniref:uncharacterized protein LOC108090676 n=1 Tax=Drosophila ficusphila TaxID=30025 RepID=UPI0007E7FE52|nr:uncharacterized protein LOC108090676 [Drosophila ficusphila]